MGVLLQLYIKNLLTCCGYCSPVEDRNAYQAVRSIQRSCRYIIQYPLVLNPNNNSNNSINSNGSNFLNSLFGSNNNSNSTKGSVRLTKPRRVRLMVQDSDVDGQPILSIIPVQNHAAEDSSSTDTTATATTTTIKLRRIDKVQLDGDQIVLYGKTKQPRKNSSGVATGTTTAMSVELLRFSILLNQQSDDDDTNTDFDEGQDTTQPSNHNNTNSSSDIVLVSTDTRNMIVHYWMVLVEWERQRRLKMKKSSTNTTTMEDADSDSEETDDIHNGNSTNFITRHAQKIQYYAQREIELQRTKRQREERKAQLLSQTNGGLKYTALAMATLQSQQQQSPSK